MVILGLLHALLFLRGYTPLARNRLLAAGYNPLPRHFFSIIHPSFFTDLATT
jgi:hypothetical protein